MRLTEQQRQAIRETTALVFGSTARVYLFGSRVDDNARGGDIDLYIYPEANKGVAGSKTRFIIELYRRIGERKIDVVIAQDPNRSIERTAIAQGVLV